MTEWFVQLCFNPIALPVLWEIIAVILCLGDMAPDSMNIFEGAGLRDGINQWLPRGGDAPVLEIMFSSEVCGWFMQVMKFPHVENIFFLYVQYVYGFCLVGFCFTFLVCWLEGGYAWNWCLRRSPSTLVRTMNCHLFDVKPLPALMLTYLSTGPTMTSISEEPFIGNTSENVVCILASVCPTPHASGASNRLIITECFVNNHPIPHL